jgi:hypothetical protein
LYVCMGQKYNTDSSISSVRKSIIQYNGKRRCTTGYVCYIRWYYGDNTAVYDKNTVIHGRLVLAVNTPYTIRHEYGRKTSTWITVKYGMYTARIWPFTAVYSDRNQSPGILANALWTHVIDQFSYMSHIFLS